MLDASAPAPAVPGIISMSPGSVPLYCFSRSSFAARSRFDQLELEDRGLADDVLGVRDVADAGHLDEDLVVLRLPRDLGSVTPSSLTRRSIVCIVWSTACSRRSRSMVGFILNS